MKLAVAAGVYVVSLNPKTTLIRVRKLRPAVSKYRSVISGCIFLAKEKCFVPNFMYFVLYRYYTLCLSSSCVLLAYVPMALINGIMMNETGYFDVLVSICCFSFKLTHLCLCVCVFYLFNLLFFICKKSYSILPPNSLGEEISR